MRAFPASRLDRLRVRAAVLRAVRGYFEAEGFLEVETPARVRNPGQEFHLVAFPAGQDRFLITSPEHHMKRLVAAGAEKIVQICRCFRAEEAGPLHQPEFTMIEWYRAGSTLGTLMADCEAIVGVAARAAGQGTEVPVPAARGLGIDHLSVAGPFERRSVRELLRLHAGLALRGDESAEQMRRLARDAGCAVDDQAGWDDAFFQVFLDKVEPHLGVARPTFVEQWPTPLAALARREAHDPLTAERFELYAGGLELANAFGELTDPVEQRARFAAELAARGRTGKTVYPMDEKLLRALGQMPPTAGIALGFDRLVMLVTGAATLAEVQAFPDDEV
jgi:lysyl-tRNA synthetase class 2